MTWGLRRKLDQNLKQEEIDQDHSMVLGTCSGWLVAVVACCFGARFEIIRPTNCFEIVLKSVLFWGETENREITLKQFLDILEKMLGAPYHPQTKGPK